MFDDEAAVDLGGDPDDLEVLIEGGIDDPTNNETGENEENVEGNQPNPESTPEQPKKRVVKRPQPKLNPERLRGPRGIATLEHVFKDFKFHGKGYEKHDLNRMMKQLEHWAHRLYPRFQFDDCLEKIEKLGHKKAVGTLVKRIRMDLETGDEPLVRADDDDDGAADKILDFSADAAESPLDAFDALLSQQLSEARARTPIHPPQLSQPPQVLSEEQKERMLRNRQLAEERRLARMKAQSDRNIQQENEGNVPSQQAFSELNTMAEQSIEVSQQDVSSVAVYSDNSRQETSQHCPEPGVGVCGAENVKHSSQFNLEHEENTDSGYTIDAKETADDFSVDMNNVHSEIVPMEEDTVVSSIMPTTRSDCESNTYIKSHEGNDSYLEPDVVQLGKDDLQTDVENRLLNRENF